MARTKKERNFYQKNFQLNNRIALTTGDPKGVGPFIAEQSLKSLGPQKTFQFLIWTDSKSPVLKIPGFKSLVFTNTGLAFESPFKENHLLQIKASGGPGEWLLQAGRGALENKVSALITGPVSKTSLKKHKVVGQTDLLKKLSHSEFVFMCFRGRFFNVILLTDHIPLKKISLNKKKLIQLFESALTSRVFLPKALQKKPLAVLGLNPHAGEGGLLGQEERLILKPLVKTHPDIEGPLSPDTAFLKKNWDKYSFFISLYHDQGLIPFKIIHEQTGFAQSLGLPFLRLGVDHGTGLGLKKQAVSSESFLSALKESLRWIRHNKS